MPERSACSVTSPPGARRSTRKSLHETTSSEPSGIQPSPDGWSGTSRTISSSPSGVTVDTVPR